MSSICVFEDDGFKDLLPLTWFRPAFDLRCGIFTLFEKIKRHYPRSNVYILCREYLVSSVNREYPGTLVGKLGKEASILFLNGRILADAELAKKIPASGADEIFESDGIVVAARLSKGNLEMIANSEFTTDVRKFFDPVRHTAKTTQVSVKTIRYFFEIVSENREQIVSDFNYMTRGGITRGKMHPSVAVYHPGGVFVDDGAEVEAFSTLDARNGPVCISKSAKIQPNSRIEGPCYIGEKCVVAAGSNIRGGTSLGPECRVGGEVEECVFQGHGNKQHYGFLGHSFIAEWVNLGAGTTNSDLKNNYSAVRIKYMDSETDSSLTFLGCCIGDHTKIAIGSLINTGSVIGVCSSIYGGRLMPKFIPSFSWGEARQLERYDVEKAVKTAKIVMNRRDVEMEDIDVDIFRKVFELTEEERKQSGIQ